MYIVLSGHISASPPDMRPKWLAILIEMGPGTEESDQILTTYLGERERGTGHTCILCGAATSLSAHCPSPCKCRLPPPQAQCPVNGTAACRPARPNAHAQPQYTIYTLFCNAEVHTSHKGVARVAGGSALPAAAACKAGKNEEPRMGQAVMSVSYITPMSSTHRLRKTTFFLLLI